MKALEHNTSITAHTHKVDALGIEAAHIHPAAFEEHVAGLQVAVHDAQVVQVLNALVEARGQAAVNCEFVCRVCVCECVYTRARQNNLFACSVYVCGCVYV